MKQLLIILFIIVGCSKKNTPEQALRDFINYRFSEGQTRGKLLEMTEGPLYESIESMKEDDFKTFISMPLKKKKVKILNTKCREVSCSITYLVRYETYEKEKKTFTTEVKKIAKVIKKEDIWKISDVTNIKGYHEASEPINIQSK